MMLHSKTPATRVRTCAILLLLAAISATNAPAQNQTFAVESFYAGIARLDESGCKTAGPLFEAAVKQDPNFADAWMYAASCREKEGRTKEAIAAYENVIRLEPDNKKAYTLAGLLYMKTNQHEKETAAFKNVVRLAPDEDKGYSYLAIAYRDAGQLDRAIVTLQQGIQTVNPDGPDPDRPSPLYSMLAIVYIKAKKYGEAIRVAEQELQVNPEDDETMYATAEAYLASGNKTQALSLYQQLQARNGELAQDLKKEIDRR